MSRFQEAIDFRKEFLGKHPSLKEEVWPRTDEEVKAAIQELIATVVSFKQDGIALNIP